MLQANGDGSSPTLDTDDLVFIQFSGAGQITAGDGLSKSADTLNLDINGLTAVADAAASGDSIAVYDASVSGPRKISALTFLSDLTSSDEFASVANKIALNLKSNGGLASSASGLELDDGNMSAVLSGALASTHSFVMVDSSGVRRIARDELLAAPAGDGLTADTVNGTLDASVPQLDSGSPGSNLSTDGAATGITISAEPLDDSAVLVLVNGVGIELGDGVKTTEAYFSGDAGTTARALADIAAGDQLIWNGATHYTLETDDIVEIRFNA